MATPEEHYQLGLKHERSGEAGKAYLSFMKAAERGHAQAQSEVGRYLEEGLWGDKKDPRSAVGWYRKSAKQGNALGLCRLAYCYHYGVGVGQDRSEAHRLFLASAEKGMPRAQNMVGRYLAEGWAGTKDQAAAAAWYRRAAENGSAFGQSNLADCYHLGTGVSKDMVEAYHWYLKAAEQGNAYAQYMVGRYLEEGLAGRKDPAAAAGWYRKAALQGRADAQYALGRCLETGFGVSQDRSEAYRWYLKAADQGNANAQNSVGVYLEEGRAGTKDPSAAIAWYRKAVDQGNATAMQNLAYCYHSGVGVGQDRTEAYRLFLRAAEKGLPRAQNMVGRYLAEGWAGAKDPVEAAKWYRRAAENGSAFGQSNLADCLHFGDGVAQDRAEAYRWYLKAAEQGNGYAQFMMGRYLEEGLAGRRDLAEAASWYRKAAAQGRKDAAEALKRVESQLSKPPASPAATSSGSTPASTSSPVPARKPADPEKEVERLLAELDALTGLKGVKREIRRRVASVRLSKLRGDDGGHGSLHMVFAGNPGTGKTTVARLVGRIYHALGLIRDGDLFVECSREDLVAGVIGQTALNTKAMIDKALGGILFIDEAYALYKAESERDFGTEAIDTLVKAMEDHRDDLVVIMAGYTEEMRTMIRDANPGLASRFRTWVEFEDYTPDELLEIATKMLDDRGREMGAGVEDALRDLIASRCRDSSFGNARGVRNLLDDVQDVMDERLARRLEEGDTLEGSELRLVSSGDVERLIGQPGDGGRAEESLDDLLAELDSLTGLSSAKRAIRIRVAQAKHAARAKAVGASVSTDASSLHMVFAGNPGTGKTTVARLVGRIYHALGIVRDAHRFVECKREDLVGQYIGQTAPKVKAFVERALGGVLFIDEAYSLYRLGDDKDFGAEAIDALVALMEDHRDDLVVIMAGYSNEMHAMIEGANPGLKSRFRTWIEFEDYTTDELASIFQGMAAARGLKLEEGCEALLHEAIDARVSLGDFGNARGVRNLLDDVVERQVLRLAEEGDAAERMGKALPREEFETIRAVDIPPAPKVPSKPRMGFA